MVTRAGGYSSWFLEWAYAAASPLYDLIVWWGLLPLGGERSCRRMFVDWLGLEPGMRVASLCCGTGTMERAILAEAPEVSITGVDLGAGQLARARKLSSWGGEPTVVLPENPGRGGRNQSLALALAEYVSDMDTIDFLVAGTDGTTSAAGGIVDGNTWSDPAAARAALRAADAGSYLERHQSLFVTGPTNTNVMDLVIAVVS